MQRWNKDKFWRASAWRSKLTREESSEIWERQVIIDIIVNIVILILNFKIYNDVTRIIFFTLL